MKRNEIIGEHKKGIKAVKYAKKPSDPAKVHAKQKEKLAPVKPLEEGAVKEMSMDLKNMSDDQFKARYKMTKIEARAHLRTKDESIAEMRDRRDSYQRDYDSSQTGFSRGHDHRGLEQELAHETNNYAVAIDGRTWKVFASKTHAQAVARSLQNKGKKASVHETGADPTNEDAGMPLGKIEKVDPATKKATIAKPDGTTIDVDPAALSPTTDGKMQMDAPDPNELKPGAEVISKEDALVPPPTDSMSPIHGGSDDHEGGDHNEIIHLLKRLSGMGMKMKEMDNGPVSVQAGIRSDLGHMKQLGGR